VHENDRWKVLIEEQLGGGESRTWRLSQVFDAGPERAGALALAHRLAREYVPKHPWSPSRRDLFRAWDGCWLVRVKGATQTFHFRVTVAEYVETIG
jgi:hypothetical protein